MAFDPSLLDIIVCPACHGTLAAQGTPLELDCAGCGRAYPIRDGIPVLLVDEARLPDAAVPLPDEITLPDAARVDGDA
jgi:uncharacterized protein YbaR (Trm112 family)